MATFEPAQTYDEIGDLLATFPETVGAPAARLVDLILALRPDLIACARPGWGSVNFRHRQAGDVCGVFPMRDEILLSFEHGRLLDNSAGLLEGDGLKRVRFLRLAPDSEFPPGELGLLLAEAVAVKS